MWKPALTHITHICTHNTYNMGEKKGTEKRRKKGEGRSRRSRSGMETLYVFHMILEHHSLLSSLLYTAGFAAIKISAAETFVCTRGSIAKTRKKMNLLLLVCFPSRSFTEFVTQNHILTTSEVQSQFSVGNC